MRSDLVLLFVAGLALVQFDHEHDSPMQLVQTGPLPTSVVNPGLGAPPPGGHLGETGRATGVLPPAGNVVQGAQGNAAARTGTLNADHVGTPPVNAVPNAPSAAVPPPAVRAVPPPPVGAVPPPAAGAVPAAPLPGR
jgi:hypothetical protein